MFVKQAENSRVRELAQKIENHPDRHAFQQFSTTTKEMIQDVGNVELF